MLSYGILMTDEPLRKMAVVPLGTACLVWPWYLLGLLGRLWQRLPVRVRVSITAAGIALGVLVLAGTYPAEASEVALHALALVLELLSGVWSAITAIMSDRFFWMFILLMLALYEIKRRLDTLIELEKGKL